MVSCQPTSSITRPHPKVQPPMKPLLVKITLTHLNGRESSSLIDMFWDGVQPLREIAQEIFDSFNLPSIKEINVHVMAGTPQRIDKIKQETSNDYD